MSELTKASKIVIDWDDIQDNLIDSVNEYVENRITVNVDSKVNPLLDRQDATELKLIEMSIETSYLQQRRSQSSDHIIECFFDESQTADFETSSNKPAEVMDDTDWNNNWKNREEDPIFKNAFLRNQKQSYMLEVVDEFNLEGVGQSYKHCISRYDSVNDCYWLMSNNGANAIGEIVKLSSSMKDGRVEVLGRWYITAIGSNIFCSGIDVTLDGTNLFITITNDSSGVSTVGLGKISINSDGTLGKNDTPNGGTLTWQEVWDSNGDFHVCEQLDRRADGHYYTDCTVWNDTHVAVSKLIYNTGLTPNYQLELEFYEIADDGAGSFETGNPRSSVRIDYIVSIGSSAQSSVGMCKNGNDLWVKLNEQGANERFIFKFDVSESGGSYSGDFSGSTSTGTPDAIKVSGRFEVTRDTDARGDNVSKEGIAISKEGDILEVVSNADGSDSGSFLAKRSLKNAKWAENQIVQVVNPASYAPSNLPASPYVIGVEGDRYYWTGDGGSGTIFRYDTITGDYEYAEVSGASYAGLYGITFKESTDTIYLMFANGSGVSIYYGYLSDFVTDMADKLISIGGSWSGIEVSATGYSADKTNYKYGLAYDADDDVVYACCGYTDKIVKFSADGTTSYDASAYDLPAPTNVWMGMGYNNGTLYVNDYTANTSPSKVYALDKTLSTSSAWYVKHIYQDMSPVFATNGQSCITVSGNDLLAMRLTSGIISRMKILEDPDVMQLHSFLSTDNILLSNSVWCSTPIVKRYFDPEDFSDIRDVPDMNYMAVGYGDNGISILHLDEFLSDVSSSGLPRRDPSKIRVQHYKEGSINNLIAVVACVVYAIYIEKDMIFVGSNGYYLTIIDLQSGKTTVCHSAVYSGQYYDGTLTERNDANGWAGTYNAELNISSVARKFHARTFIQDDPSDYKGANPATFVAVGTDGGTELLRIDWDENNNNRTPVRIWNNLANDVSMGARAVWIAPSGTLFMGDYAVNGSIKYYNIPVWEINEDQGADVTEVDSDLCGGVVVDISPNSRYWKTISGDDRHQLIVGTDGDGSAKGGIQIVDVENETLENIWNVEVATSYEYTSIDNYEDLAFGARLTSSFQGFDIFKKLRFRDELDTYYRNQWTHMKTSGGFDGSTEPAGITEKTRPMFTRMPIAYSTINPGEYQVRYSPEHGILSFVEKTASVPNQIFHFPNMDQCIHVSETFDCDNPSQAHYIQNAILPESEVVTVTSTGDANITYTDGATATWTSTGNVMTLNRDGTTEGYLEWENITGYVGAGIHFIKDDDSGGVKVTVTDVTTSTVVPDWDEENISIYHAEASVDDDYVCWITLPDATHEYKIKVEHSGENNGGSNDYIRIQQYFLIEELAQSEIETVATMWHTDWTSVTRDYTLTAGSTVDIEETQTFNGDDSTTEFVLSGNNHAYTPVSFSVDGGTNWLLPYDYTLTWGSNATDYDDETVNTSTGYFGVSFDTPPATGTGNVIIKYQPTYDKYYVTRTMKQPNDGASYVDLGVNVRLLDDAVEMI